MKVTVVIYSYRKKEIRSELETLYFYSNHNGQAVSDTENKSANNDQVIANESKFWNVGDVNG